MDNDQMLWRWTRSLFAILIATLMLSTTAWADDDDDDDDDDNPRHYKCHTESVQGFPIPGFDNPPPIAFPEEGIEGRARLCVTHAGLRGNMRVHNLTWMNTYTVWWVYIDKPFCNDNVGFWQCIGAFFGDQPTDVPEFPPEAPCYPAIPCVAKEPLAVFGRMDSGISPRNGRLRFANLLDDMRVNSGSQVWMLMFGHGMKSDDGRQLARQLLTPEDPASGYPHVGVEPNGYPAAVAIFEIP